MKIYRHKSQSYSLLLLVIAGVLSSCMPAVSPSSLLVSASPTPDLQLKLFPTALPTRPSYQPGELVDYIVQTGDNLPALALHFNTSEQEIRSANPIIPDDATTLPPGMPMKIPIYYESLWGTSFQIIPDSLFINGPAQVGFDPVKFVNSQPGWFKNFQTGAGGVMKNGGEMVAYLATNYSISPRLLLALIEYQTGALTQILPPEAENNYPLGFVQSGSEGLYNQLLWAANILNNGYYDWRIGKLSSFEHPDGRLEHPDPWQNAATVALQYYYSRLFFKDDYLRATQGEGILKTYKNLFGDPWKNVSPHIPVSLHQPELSLPFQAGKAWAFTGGPHTGWGEGDPLAAIDFAPPSVIGGCTPTKEWTTAIADGVIVRIDPGIAVLDLDGDNDERTGWVIFYLHLATEDKVKLGAILNAGDPIGHPSCEGGHSTGTHIHIARKYNGEWIPADGPLAFNLEGWIAKYGSQPYEGTLSRYNQQIRACECSDHESQLTAEKEP